MENSWPRSPLMSDFFSEQGAPRFVSDLTCTSEWELSLRVNHRQSPPFCSSVREGTSLAAISAAPDVPHSATQRYTPDHIISASVHAPVSQLLPRPLAADSHRAPHSFDAIGAAQAECPERQLEDGSAMHVPEVQIGVNQEVRYTGHGSTYARNDLLLSRHGWAEEDLGPLSQDILDDADSLLSAVPNILDDSVLYSRNWTVLDMVRFNRIRISELMITCQWGACTESFQVNQIKAHLKYKHRVKLNPKPYRCFWNGCSSRRRMTELSSLARHVLERHGSVDWQCLTCEESFTRDETLLKHFDKCPGRSKLQVEPRGEIVSD